MDVLTLIKRDHAEVKDMFKQFEELSPTAKATRAKLGTKIMDALEAHTSAEETTLYAALRDQLRAGEERIKVLEGFEEHGVANDLIAKIKDTDPKDDSYVARMDVLRESVEHHIKEEESVIHKLARGTFDKSELDEFGTRFQQAKERVGTAR